MLKFSLTLFLGNKQEKNSNQAEVTPETIESQHQLMKQLESGVSHA